MEFRGSSYSIVMDSASLDGSSFIQAVKKKNEESVGFFVVARIKILRRRRKKKPTEIKVSRS